MMVILYVSLFVSNASLLVTCSEVFLVCLSVCLTSVRCFFYMDIV